MKMSSTDSNLFKSAMQEATQAVDLDQAQKYSEAKVKYMKAAEILEEFMKYTKNPNLKQTCTEKVQEYRYRAKQLKGKKKNVKDGGVLIKSINVIFSLLLVLIIFLLSQFPTYTIIPVIILIIYISSLALNRISRIKREKIEKIKNEKSEKVKQIDEINLKKRKDLKLKSKRDIEQEIVEKIRSMMEVSERISLEMMRKTLEMDSDEFLNNIWGWAKKFGFRIDGDYIIVENADVGEFVKYLDDQFLNWKKKEGIKEEKNADLLDEIE